jgi:hypothetical protein
LGNTTAPHVVEILVLCARDCSAHVLSENIVKTHVSSILAKLGSDAAAAGDNLRAFTGERISDGGADALGWLQRSDLSEIHMM